MELDYCPLISSLIFVRYYSERLHCRYEKKTNRKMTEEKKTKMEKNYFLCVLWQVYILLIVVPNFREKYHENNNNNNTFIYVALVSSAQGAYNHTKYYVIN